MLCRTLGRTLAELRATLNSDELTLWMAEYQREPWGDYRGDIQAAITASATVNSMGGRTKPNDFIPKWEAPVVLSWAEASNFLSAWAEGQNRKGASG